MESSFPRSVDALDELFRVSDAFFEREKIDDAHRHDARLALEEVFVNLVRHNSGEQPILLRLEREGDRLRMTLVDRDVERFDLTRAPTPRIDAPLDARRPGGLGIHLTRTLMDDVRYAYENRQSTITLIKRVGETPC